MTCFSAIGIISRPLWKSYYEDAEFKEKIHFRERGGKMNKIPEITDIVDTWYLQAMLNNFSKDMEKLGIRVAAAILNKEAVPLTLELNHCAFCEKIRNLKEGVRLCRDNDRKGIDLAENHYKYSGKTEPFFYICSFGIIDFCVPIVINNNNHHGEIVAFLFGGQLRGTCKNSNKSISTPQNPDVEILLNNLQQAKESERLPQNDIEAYKTQFNEAYEAINILSADQFEKLRIAVNSLVSQLSSVIEYLNTEQRVQIFEAFMNEAKEKTSIKDLFNVTVEILPLIMEAKYCSIFTVQYGKNPEDDRLVLRKTNYLDLQPMEESAEYERGVGLTGWVWENARSLRLEDVQNKEEIALYDKLEWVGRHNECKPWEHKGFLGVPMIGHNKKVIGVIRMPCKEDNRSFSKYDEIFLNFIATHLSSVMECQDLQEKFRYMSKANKILIEAAEGLTKNKNFDKILSVISDKSKELFNQENRNNAYFVNIQIPGTKKWRPKVIEGDLPIDENCIAINKAFDENVGLTGKVIRDKEPVLIHDLEKAKKEGCYIEAAKQAKSAMAAPLLYKHKIYGAIAIASDKKFTFSWDNDVEALRQLAESSAKAIVKSRLFSLRAKINRFFETVYDLWRQIVPGGKKSNKDTIQILVSDFKNSKIVPVKKPEDIKKADFAVFDQYVENNVKYLKEMIEGIITICEKHYYNISPKSKNDLADIFIKEYETLKTKINSDIDLSGLSGSYKDYLKGKINSEYTEIQKCLDEKVSLWALRYRQKRWRKIVWFVLKWFAVPGIGLTLIGKLINYLYK